MARRRKAEKREVRKDTRFQNEMLGRMVTILMKSGKRSVAERIVYDVLDTIEAQTKQDPVEIVEKAIENVKPRLEVKSRRVGGATYQVPVEVSGERQVTLALRWLSQYAKARKGMPMRRALAMELMDAYKEQGATIKKRDDTHKMAAANKAFAHYRW